MGFWSRIKDVVLSGPTTAVKNERAEDAADRAAKDAAERAKHAPQPKVEVPPTPKADAPAPTPEPPAAPAEPAQPAQPAEPEYRTYTVKSGDTLSEIAASYGVDWHEMARLNNLENPDLIYPGQVFKVPNS
ncbi:MAG: LysM peptidoglycan-binding domain-containing protein [Aeromicrobium sp.]